MKTLGIITARGNSKRLPNKNLMRFMGKPLLWHTIEAAKQSSSLSRCVCSSDNDAILKFAKRYGIEPIKRSPRAATDRAPIEDALRDTLAVLKKREGYCPQTVVLLYGNVPYRKKGLIDEALRLFKRRKADAVVSVSGVDRYHPERLVVKGSADAFIPYVKKFSSYRAQELSKVYFIDSGVIVLKTSLLFGKDPLVISHYFEGHRVVTCVTEDIGAWDIDNYTDLAIGRLLFQRHRSEFVI